MIIANGEEVGISRVELPAVANLDVWQDPIHVRQLGATALTVECKASALQSRNGRVNRLQLADSDGTIIISSRETQELLDGASDRALKVATAGEIEDGVLRIKGRHEWLRHPGLLKVANLAEAARNSWSRGVAFTVEDRAAKRPGLRPPQIGALHAIAAHWTVSTAPALIVMPTGTGKTEVMLAVLVMHRPQRLLVIVPSDLLRQQTFEKFSRLGVLGAAGVIGSDVVLPVVGGLFGAPQSDDIAKLEQCNVVVATMASLAALGVMQLRKLLGLFDMVFFDEAHHVRAASWERLSDQLTKQLVVQFTATPFRLDGLRIPGRIIYNFPLRLAQEQGYFEQIDFLEVVSLDDDEADRQIAKLAVDRLRADRSQNKDHLLLARADTQHRAERLLAEIYEPLCPDLKPVVIHSQSPQRREKLEAIRARQHLVIICVDMFGEGYDLPQLKIAALHDIHQSLAITLQFTGRFTRTSAGLGRATIVANVANPKVSDAIEELYAEDSDWNDLIPKLSARAIKSQQEFSDFLQRMEKSELGDDELFSLNVLRPATSMVLFKAPAFNPKNFRTAIKKGVHVQRAWISKDRDYLVFITRTRASIDWATIKEANDEIWDLFILAHDAKRGVLYLNSSQTKPLHTELATAVCGKDAKVVSGEDVFRALHGLKRITMQNVGLKPRGKKLSFHMYVGPDVMERISPAAQINASKSNLFVLGYDGGKRVSIGVSAKGKVWSRSTASIPDWRNWCEMIAARILDNSLPTDDFLKDTLMPTQLKALPGTALFSVALPSAWFSDEMDSASIIADGRKFNLDQVGIESWTVVATDVIAFEFAAVGGFSATFNLKWGPTAGDFVVSQESGPTVELQHRGNRPRLDEYLKESPPTVFLADGSEIEGGLLKSPRDKLVHTLPLTQMEEWDWSGVDILVESMWKNGHRRAKSIQERVMTVLAGQNNTVVFDDDDAGESADVVEIAEGADQIVFRFFHCKYSGATNPGDRAKDLYEVCGQAVRSTRWHNNPDGLIDHLHQRSLPGGRNGRTTRFFKGDERALVLLKRKLRQLRCSYEVVVVQPGISRKALEADNNSILGSANHFLLEMTASPLRAIVSA